MIDPTKLGEVIAWQFPQSSPDVDWRVAASGSSNPAIVAWDAAAMGQAQPNQATIDGWETTYNSAGNQANRTGFARELRVYADLVNRFRVLGVPPEAAVVRVLKDLVLAVPAGSRTATMTRFLNQLAAADADVP